MNGSWPVFFDVWIALKIMIPLLADNVPNQPTSEVARILRKQKP